ncbi:MAG TPA: DNA methyltransferase [Bacteroidales bacterium]|nr:DNA methyltransferase [Bacteroidales bacterium]
MNIESTELQNSTETAIGYIPCYRLPFLSLFHADCMEIMKQYPDKYFDLAIVDPPYGINADTNQMGLANKKGFTKNAGTYKEYHKTNWDSEPPKKEYFEELERVSKNQIVWGGNYFFDLHLTGVIVWNKKGSGNFKEGELAKTSINTFKVFNYSRADAYINDCDVKIHPTQKPERIYGEILKHYTTEGMKILDTHFGSGSIALAVDKANKLDKMNLHLTACEIDKEYIDKAIKRISESIKQGTLSF